MPMPAMITAPFEVRPTTLGRRNMWNSPRLAEVTSAEPTSPMSAHAASTGSGERGRIWLNGVTAMRLMTM